MFQLVTDNIFYFSILEYLYFLIFILRVFFCHLGDNVNK